MRPEPDRRIVQQSYSGNIRDDIRAFARGVVGTPKYEMRGRVQFGGALTIGRRPTRR